MSSTLPPFQHCGQSSSNESSLVKQMQIPNRLSCGFYRMVLSDRDTQLNSWFVKPINIHFYIFTFQQLNNPNATYTCTVQNRWGNEHKTITNREIDAIPDPAPAMASLPVIIGIAFCAILVLVIGGFVFYKYFLNPRQSEKNDPYRPYNPAHSNTDHIITGVPYDTGSKHRLERPDEGKILVHFYDFY